MSEARYVDRLPIPEKVRKKEIILLSYSRSGTLGLYKAFEILGYKPYHMAEVIRNGYSHTRMFHEALLAKHWSKGRPYTRMELDKWMWDYDALAIVPCYLTEEVVNAYPDAKFILTMRDSESWATSVWNTIGMLNVATTAFPLRILKQFDKSNFEFCNLVNRIFDVITGGHGRTEAGFQAALKEYDRHNESIQSMIPPERLLMVQLEDGLGWKEICPFLGKDIPDTPYPRQNDPNEFKALIQGSFSRGNKKAITIIAAILGAAGLGLLYML